MNQVKRKVREDFDATKEYSVNVADCTKEEKETVRQAFFDAGFRWECWGSSFQFLDAVLYTNTLPCGRVTGYCMFGSSIERSNMSVKEFLTLVYEPEQQGHIHAESMALYAEDAKTHVEPWKLWQFKYREGMWVDLSTSPSWLPSHKYRRKPKTYFLHGVEIPDLRIEPKNGQEYWYPDPSTAYFVGFSVHGAESSVHRLENNLCYERTEEGKQAAVKHAKAMLGI